MINPKTPIVIGPGEFEPENHFYPKALNAQIHPLVRYFMDMGNERIALRYCHLHPEANAAAVRAALAHVTKQFRWGGADLFTTTTDRGQRRLVVVETNSCPSGQKSMPLVHEREERGGYEVLLERSFLPMLKRRALVEGGLAVIFDKNPMEASGYAATLADLTGEPVHLVPFHRDAVGETVRWDDRILSIRVGGQWRPIRAAFRYVTQQPWNRIPPLARTLVYNPVVACLAGGRNKMLAAKAYDVHNATLRPDGLAIRTPETIWDVGRAEVPMWVEALGGVAVVKNPYSNAGQGVYTITRPSELEAFMDLEQSYDRFIVQALIGNQSWSSRGREGRLYHVGTVPNRRGEIFVADLRVMVGVSPDGFFPVAVYARRSRTPLVDELRPDSPGSWDMLGTNLSVKNPDGSWGSDTARLLLMDRRDFNQVGVGLDDLIEGYIQTVLSVTAIDNMSMKLLTQKKLFRRRFFSQLNPDPALVEEIIE